jgi:hypothetical protein
MLPDPGTVVFHFARASVTIIVRYARCRFLRNRSFSFVMAAFPIILRHEGTTTNCWNTIECGGFSRT